MANTGKRLREDRRAFLSMSKLYAGALPAEHHTHVAARWQGTGEGVMQVSLDTISNNISGKSIIG